MKTIFKYGDDNFKMLSSIIVILSLINLTSCDNKNINGASIDAPLISVSLPANHQLVNFDSVVGRPEKWHVDEEYVYLVSKKQLYVFNLQGKLVFEISSPKISANHCSIMDVKSIKNEVFVLCEDKGLVQVINKRTWEIQRSIEIGVNASAIEVTKNSLFVYQTPNTLNIGQDAKNYQLMIFDHKGNLLDKYFPYSKPNSNSYQFSEAVVQTFAKFNDNISFSRFMNDTVYYFDDEGNQSFRSLIGLKQDYKEGLSAKELLLKNEDINIPLYPVYFSYNEQYEAVLYLKSFSLGLILKDKKNGKSYNISDFEDLKSNYKIIPAVKIYQDELFVFISDESVIGMNENRNTNDNSILGKNLTQLQQYEKYQILLHFKLNDLQLQ
ncbi:MAG: hypothetical protein ACI9XJ_001761 [Marivirga sp.]|jgi:hypothetical protein